MKSDGNGMWLSEKEAAVIELYRQQTEEGKAEIYSAVSALYEEKIRFIREADETEKLP